MDQTLTVEQLRALGIVADHRFADGSAAVPVKTIVHRAIECAAIVAAIDDVLDNGGDEHLWPPGLSRASAIKQIIGDRSDLADLLRRALPMLKTPRLLRKTRSHFGMAPTKGELARRSLRAEIRTAVGEKSGAPGDKSDAPESEKVR